LNGSRRQKGNLITLARREISKKPGCLNRKNEPPDTA
jgi:hypothetical protein